MKSRNWQNILALILILLSAISGIATYAALTETPPFGDDPNAVIWLLNIDLILLLALVGLIARRLVGLWSGRKRGLAGSHLHVRLVYIFSVLAAAPAIIMTIFSAVFFYYGVQTWFSERVSTAINESQAVAEAYLKEHMQTIRADTLAMANDLNREAGMLLMNEKAFGQVMQTHSLLRDLSEAIIFDARGRVLARSGLTFSLEFEDIPNYALEVANDGEVAIMTGRNEDRVRALVKLDSFSETYLFVGRMIDPQVLSHLASTKKATQDYAALKDQSSGLQVILTMIFVVVGLLLLMAAIWFGLLLARQLVRPISILITTADRVRAGDLSARVPEQASSLHEFDYLAQSFNRMTRRVQEQQNELIEANRQLDRRRHFTETVLTGVTSGVIGVGGENQVTVVNVSACELLGVEKEHMVGRNIDVIMPEVQDLLLRAHNNPDKITQDEIPFVRGDIRRVFLVRIAIELIGEEETGTILTFDDITELQAAQRKAAWSDVARKIAHEIKNPLTPIQLSAERLNKRYLEQIDKDQDTFKECIETIIRHVGDIGHMVNEFSSFARMPEPVLKTQNLNKEVLDSLVIHRQAHNDVQIQTFGFDDHILYVNADNQQLRQAVNNLVQNAVESFIPDEGKGPKDPKINICIGRHGEDAFIAVMDNGPGFPKDDGESHLTEPYVTYKRKGTGLGLAIVKKIMEDHDGRLVLGAPEWLKKYNCEFVLQGATAMMILPIKCTEDATD